MVRTLKFPNVKALSLNACFSNTPHGRVKSKKYTEFTKVIDGLMLAQKNSLLDLMKHFNEFEHYITCDWKFYFPIFKKDGHISKTAGDVSNMIKPIEDLIFKKLSIDDAYIVSGSFVKIESNYLGIEVTITIKDVGLIQ